ncbi:MAG TPA: hypothetical protein VM912_12525, partial [Terriglobales bacterium]|nr:hypothetical protein [Terriglobales bacterium]
MFDYVVVHSPARVALVLAVIALLGLSCDLNAQQVIILRNVDVIDGTGAPVQRQRTVTIAGDRIRSISSSQASTPSNAAIHDMHGLTIMPLIINTHGHLGLVKGTSQSTANQTDENLRHQLLRYREYGVGAVLSMGTDGQNFAQMREASRRGTLPGA